jgi:hypothetical protein
MHIIEPPGIRTLLAYRMSLARGIAAIPPYSIQVRIMSTEELHYVTISKGCNRSRTTGILPFCLGGQSIDEVSGTIKLLDEFLTLIPGDPFHREIITPILKT